MGVYTITGYMRTDMGVYTITGYMRTTMGDYIITMVLVGPAPCLGSGGTGGGERGWEEWRLWREQQSVLQPPALVSVM